MMTEAEQGAIIEGVERRCREEAASGRSRKRPILSFT